MEDSGSLCPMGVSGFEIAGRGSVRMAAKGKWMLVFEIVPSCLSNKAPRLGSSRMAIIVKSWLWGVFLNLRLACKSVLTIFREAFSFDPQDGLSKVISNSPSAGAEGH